MRPARISSLGSEVGIARNANENIEIEKTKTKQDPANKHAPAGRESHKYDEEQQNTNRGESLDSDAREAFDVGARWRAKMRRQTRNAWQ